MYAKSLLRTLRVGLVLLVSSGVVLPSAADANAIEHSDYLNSVSDDSHDECCAGGAIGRGLRQYLRTTDTRFNQFISPITNPVFFEDPRSLTEARLIFLNHELPGSLGGGDVQLYAMQVRAAITDRLSLIAIKDGFVVGQPNAPHDDGWADVAAGLKYRLWTDDCNTRVLSGGLTFELPVGSTRALQGTGDGEFNLFLSSAAELSNGWLWMSATGFRLPTNAQEESQVWYLSNHLSHRLGCTNTYVVGEVNLYHWMRAGNQPALAGVEGLDLYSFGSTGVAGNDIVTGAIGVKHKPSNWIELGLAWEAPLTSRRDILDNRITVDCILRF